MQHVGYNARGVKSKMDLQSTVIPEFFRAIAPESQILLVGSLRTWETGVNMLAMRVVSLSDTFPDGK